MGGGEQLRRDGGGARTMEKKTCGFRGQGTLVKNIVSMPFLDFDLSFSVTDIHTFTQPRSPVAIVQFEK